MKQYKVIVVQTLEQVGSIVVEAPNESAALEMVAEMLDDTETLSVSIEEEEITDLSIMDVEEMGSGSDLYGHA